MSRVRKSPDADETSFDVDGTNFDPAEIFTVGDALRNLDQLDLETLTEFEAFSSPGRETTTSNGWVTKSGYPYTSATKPAGDYLINHTALVGNSDKEKQTGHRVQWREGTSGTWITLVDIRNAVSVDDGQDLRTGFNIVTLSTETDFQVRIQFGQTDDGGTGDIEEANITIGKVSEA